MEFSMVETGSNRVQYVESGAEEERMGGEGFGNIVMLMAILGALVLVAIIIFAALALSGQFINPHMDSPV
jgi:uncharacterized membrane protein